MVPPDVAERLSRIVRRGGVVFLGIGNVLAGDDGFGPLLAAELSALGFTAIDAGTVPENQIGAVARRRPRTVVLLDAAHLEREPGDIELLDAAAVLDGTGLTTHNLSPAMVMERLAAETGAEILMLAAQPASTRFGDDLTPLLAAALGDVVRFFALLSQNN